jgi:hypothetical protein
MLESIQPAKIWFNQHVDSSNKNGVGPNMASLYLKPSKFGDIFQPYAVPEGSHGLVMPLSSFFYCLRSHFSVANPFFEYRIHTPQHFGEKKQSLLRPTFLNPHSLIR